MSSRILDIRLADVSPPRASCVLSPSSLAATIPFPFLRFTHLSSVLSSEAALAEEEVLLTKEDHVLPRQNEVAAGLRFARQPFPHQSNNPLIH